MFTGSPGVDLAPSGTLGNVRRHLWLSLLGLGGAAKHSTVHGAAPTAKKDAAQDVGGAEGGARVQGSGQEAETVGSETRSSSSASPPPSRLPLLSSLPHLQVRRKEKPHGGDGGFGDTGS